MIEFQAMMYYAHEFITARTGERETDPILVPDHAKEDLSPQLCLQKAYQQVMHNDTVNAGGDKLPALQPLF